LPGQSLQAFSLVFVYVPEFQFGNFRNQDTPKMRLCSKVHNAKMLIVFNSFGAGI